MATSVMVFQTTQHLESKEDGDGSSWIQLLDVEKLKTAIVGLMTICYREPADANLLNIEINKEK